MLRVAFVPGVSPDKWFRRWRQRYPDAPLETLAVSLAQQRSILTESGTDMCFIRLPIDRDGLHVIPLYTEDMVVLAAKDHEITAFAELNSSDLEGEEWLDAGDRPISEVLDLVAAGAGVLLLPSSVARHYNRRDIRFRPVRDVPGSEVGLAWRRDREEPEFEQFIGIVRGRTENSSRGTPLPGDDVKPGAGSTKANSAKTTPAKTASAKGAKPQKSRRPARPQSQRSQRNNRRGRR